MGYGMLMLPKWLSTNITKFDIIGLVLIENSHQSFHRKLLKAQINQNYEIFY
jgi:hypothetical protein